MNNKPLHNCTKQYNHTGISLPCIVSIITLLCCNIFTTLPTWSSIWIFISFFIILLLPVYTQKILNSQGQIDLSTGITIIFYVYILKNSVINDQTLIISILIFLVISVFINLFLQVTINFLSIASYSSTLIIVIAILYIKPQQIIMISYYIQLSGDYFKFNTHYITNWITNYPKISAIVALIIVLIILQFLSNKVKSTWMYISIITTNGCEEKANALHINIKKAKINAYIINSLICIITSTIWFLSSKITNNLLDATIILQVLICGTLHLLNTIRLSELRKRDIIYAIASNLIPFSIFCSIKINSLTSSIMAFLIVALTNKLLLHINKSTV